MTHGTDRDSLTLARQTWRTLEPYHGAVYFSPEAAGQYAQLGVDAKTGYFASRSAALGAAPADLVIATFYNFNPQLVRRAIPAAWEAATPQRFAAARLTAVDAMLRRILGTDVSTPALTRAAELARAAAEVAVRHPQGRPLFAAHAALPWPSPPHMVLWHAQTLLREFRGDGHVAALLTAGLSGLEATPPSTARAPRALRKGSLTPSRSDNRPRREHDDHHANGEDWIDAPSRPRRTPVRSARSHPCRRRLRLERTCSASPLGETRPGSRDAGSFQKPAALCRHGNRRSASTGRARRTGHRDGWRRDQGGAPALRVPLRGARRSGCRPPPAL